MQLLGAGLLILLPGDISLVVHLVKDDLLAPLVGLGVEVGVVHGGVVRDADDGAHLGQRQILHLFVEVVPGRVPDALGIAVAEVDHVEIPLHDLPLLVLLLHLEGGEDLGELPADGGLVFSGHVFPELLGDGGAAEGVLHPGEHVDEGAGGADPVHAVVPVEPLVLDGHQRVLHVQGDLLVGHPVHVALLALDGGGLHPLLPRLVIIIDDAGLVELIFLQGNAQILGDQVRLDEYDEDAGEDGPGGDQYQKENADGLEQQAKRLRSPVKSGLRRFFDFESGLIGQVNTSHFREKRPAPGRIYIIIAFYHRRFKNCSDYMNFSLR